MYKYVYFYKKYVHIAYFFVKLLLDIRKKKKKKKIKKRIIFASFLLQKVKFKK